MIVGIFVVKSGSVLLSVSFWTRKHNNPKVTGSHLGNEKEAKVTMKATL